MKLKEDLILIGGGEHCRSCVDVIEMDGRFDIYGIVDEKNALGSTLKDYPLLGGEKDLGTLSKSCQNFLITIGQIKFPEPRIRLFEHLKQLGMILPIVVSPGPHCSTGFAWGGNYHYAPRPRQRWSLSRT
jgi:hypothetical protein